MPHTLRLSIVTRARFVEYTAPLRTSKALAGKLRKVPALPSHHL